MAATDRMPDSFFANEGSPTPSPAYLYVLQHPDGAKIFWTGYDYDVEVENLPVAFGAADPQTFSAVQIAHGMNEVSAEFEKRKMTVSVVATDTRFRRFFATAAAVEMTLTIIRVNTPSLTAGEMIDYDQDCTIVNAGTISDFAFAGQVITVSLVPAPYDVDKGIPRYFFNRQCNHPLFSAACGLLKADYDRITTIAAVDRPNRTLTLTGQDGADADGSYLRYGFLEHALTGFKVGIEAASLNGSDTDVTLAYWVTDFAVGQTVTVYPGCDHTSATCKAKFSNQANFGGFPFVPAKNPVLHSAT